MRTASFRIGQFVARYAARETARMEDLTVFIGDGTGTYDSKTGITKYVNDQTKIVQHAVGGTSTSAITMAKVRALRAVPNSSVLGTAKYYFHPSMEQAFAAFNTAGDKPYIANGINGASLDGFPIVWVDALPAYNASATINVVYGLFGDLRFAYMGIRGGYRFDTSSDVFFATDEVAIRALERFDIQHMATDYAAGIKTSAT
jgi:HK97 family phage major capsid protein